MQRHTIHRLGLIVAITATLAFTISPAWADSATSPDNPITAVSAATPETVEKAAAVNTSDSGTEAINSTVNNVKVKVPSEATAGIEVEKGSTRIRVDLPFATKADKSKKRGNGIVSYDNRNGSVTVPVVLKDGSVQMNTVIQNAAAPSSYSYAITVPTGGSLRLEKDGSVSILDSNASWKAGIAAPWAKDSKGANLPTYYTVSATTLTQTVDLSVKNITFPVVADPWLGIDLIDHTTWGNLWQYSPTLEVFPTWWGRYGAGAPANGAAWSETLAKTSRSGHPNPNTSSMQVQFDCHFQVVRIKAPNKPSWNLDTKLPWTDFANEVRYGCNYPTGNREF